MDGQPEDMMPQALVVPSMEALKKDKTSGSVEQQCRGSDTCLSTTSTEAEIYL